MISQIIDCYGYIVKEEKLWCQNELSVKNTCILESLEPYPGYYGNFPHETKPHIVYFVTKSAYSYEEIIRIAKKIKITFPDTFNVAISSISMFENNCFAIRISNLNDYNLISQLQQEFIDHGIIFKQKNMNIENEPALIKVKKFFHLNEFPESNIYLDQNKNETGYFAIPKYIDWDQFKKIILNIKYNNTDIRFDAASGCFYSDSDITDVVRIFTKNINFNTLAEIKQSFYSRM